MAIGIEQAIKAKEPPPSVRVSVRIPKEHKMHKSVDLGKLKIGQSTKINLSGNVKSIGQSDYDKSFDIEVDNLGFGEEKLGTMGGDLAKIRKQRTMNYKPDDNEEE